MGNYKYPAAIVFDLDYTLWPWWCDCHVTPPIQTINGSQLIDSTGLSLQLFEDVHSILEELERHKVTIIGASRTATPEIAIKILSLFNIKGKPMIDYFDSLQWGQHTKIRHIKSAAIELGLEKQLSDGALILFDDEARNRDVILINCHFAFISDSKYGLTRKIFEDALRKWTASKQDSISESP